MNVRIDISILKTYFNEIFTEVSNKSKKEKDNSLEKSHNKRNKTNKVKTKEMKSPNKDSNMHSKTTTSSPPKQKLQNEKKHGFSSDEDFDTSNKHTDNASEKLDFKNVLSPSASTSTSKDVSNGRKSLNRKKVEADLFEERAEKKKQRAILYEKYLQRGGARNPGSKTIPTVRVYTFVYNYNYT